MSDYDEAKTWINLAERDYAVASHLQKTFVPLPVDNRSDIEGDFFVAINQNEPISTMLKNDAIQY